MKLEKPNAEPKSGFRLWVETGAKYLELSETLRRTAFTSFDDKPHELKRLDEMIDKHKQISFTEGFLARAMMEWADDAEHRVKKPRVG